MFPAAPSTPNIKHAVEPGAPGKNLRDCALSKTDLVVPFAARLIAPLTAINSP